jgi:elongation factor G
MDRIRNIGISAHIDSGKTTLTERILFYTGKIDSIHEVRGKDGVGATMDHMELEREKGITITSAATYCIWKGPSETDYQVNIIDTPGHVDFTIEVERAQRVLDGSVLVCCGVGGVQSQTLTVDRQMRRYGVPRVVFVNKLDRYGADPFFVLEQIKKKLGLDCAAIQIPIGEENNFVGVVDVIEMQANYFEGQGGIERRVGPVPPELVEKSEKVRADLIEMLADLDDEFAETYLGGELTPADLHAAIRRTTLARSFVPMLMGSAYKNKGVQNLLDAVARYLPAPPEKENAALDVENDEAEVVLSSDASAPLVAMAFKIQDHPTAGTLTYVRIYQGTLRKGAGLTNVSNRKKVTPKRIVRVHSSELRNVESLGPGEIAAVSGIDVESGATLTDGRLPYALRSMFVPDPVMSISINVQSKEDISKLSKALTRFKREDPTFSMVQDQETGDMVMAGMGELHLEVYLERMRREYNLDVVTGEPKVKYRETITQRTTYDYQHKRQSGGRGQYGKVIGYFEPISTEEGDYPDRIEFVNELSGNDIPPNYVPSIEKGFREHAQLGLLTGHPVMNIRFVLQDGQAHEVDSSDIAFRLAAGGAYETYYEDAAPLVLEPLMTVEVVVPTEFQAAGMQTISSRKGAVSGTSSYGDQTTINAVVPLKNMFGYSTELRGQTQGQGEFSMEFSHYFPMQQVDQEVLMKEFQEAKLNKKTKA